MFGTIPETRELFQLLFRCTPETIFGDRVENTNRIITQFTASGGRIQKYTRWQLIKTRGGS